MQFRKFWVTSKSRDKQEGTPLEGWMEVSKRPLGKYVNQVEALCILIYSICRHFKSQPMSFIVQRRVLFFSERFSFRSCITHVIIWIDWKAPVFVCRFIFGIPIFWLTMLITINTFVIIKSTFIFQRCTQIHTAC